MARLEVRYMEW